MSKDFEISEVRQEMFHEMESRQVIKQDEMTRFVKDFKISSDDFNKLYDKKKNELQSKIDIAKRGLISGVIDEYRVARNRDISQEEKEQLGNQVRKDLNIMIGGLGIKNGKKLDAIYEKVQGLLDIAEVDIIREIYVKDNHFKPAKGDELFPKFQEAVQVLRQDLHDINKIDRHDNSKNLSIGRAKFENSVQQLSNSLEKLGNEINAPNSSVVNKIKASEKKSLYQKTCKFIKNLIRKISGKEKEPSLPKDGKEYKLARKIVNEVETLANSGMSVGIFEQNQLKPLKGKLEKILAEKNSKENTRSTQNNKKSNGRGR